MPFYSGPPHVEVSEELRRARHAQLLYLIGIGDPGEGGGGEPVITGIFQAPLMLSLVPTVAGNPTFTMLRPDAGYVTDHEGVLRQALPGEARFPGARRIRNLLVKSEELTFNGGWSINGLTVTTGVADPLGGTSASTLTATGSNATCIQQATSAAVTSEMYTNSAWIRRRTGAGTIRFKTPNGGESFLEGVLSSTWKRFAVTTVPNVPNVNMGFRIDVAGDAIDVAFSQCENVSGQSNQAPGDYVSRGVLPAPQHGSGIDGVKYLATTNANTVGTNTNILFWSQGFDNAEWVKLEAPITVDSTLAPDGTMTAETMADTANGAAPHIWYQDKTFITNGGTYTYSIHFKCGTLSWMTISFGSTGNNRWVNFNVAGGVVGSRGSSTTAATITALPNGWYRCSVTLTADSTNCRANIMTNISDSIGNGQFYAGTGKTMYVWGAQLEPGSVMSDYIPTTISPITNCFVTETAGAVIPAANLPGYLAEDNGTNICKWSEDFNNAVWTKTNCTITANAQLAPNGVQTADTITDNATSGVHQVTQTMDFTIAGAASIYAKAGTLTWIQLACGATRWANFNLVAGTIGTAGSGTTPVIIPLANGWYRCAINGSSISDFHIYAAASDSATVAPSYVGTGKTVYLWGAQAEDKDLSTYIPSTTAYVSRTVDILTFPTVSNFSNATGSVYAEVYLTTPLATRTQTLVAVIVENQLMINQPTKTAAMEASGPALATANTRTLGAYNKLASAWSGTTASICLNGGTVATGTLTGLPFETTGDISIGRGLTPLCGSIRNVKIYNVRFTDAELVTMTT